MRLFLALEMPPDLRDEIARVASRLRNVLPGWRWIRPENVHLTLRFLGETAAAALERLEPDWCRTARGAEPIRFRVSGCGVFPGPRRPRVLWAGVHDETPGAALERLADGLEQVARSHGYPPEPRRFRPHLTLARAGRGRTPAAPEPAAVGELGEVLAREVVLFRSELHPTGARYEAIARYPLGDEDLR